MPIAADCDQCQRRGSCPQLGMQVPGQATTDASGMPLTVYSVRRQTGSQCNARAAFLEQLWMKVTNFGKSEP